MALTKGGENWLPVCPSKEQFTAWKGHHERRQREGPVNKESLRHCNKIWCIKFVRLSRESTMHKLSTLKISSKFTSFDIWKLFAGNESTVVQHGNTKQLNRNEKYLFSVCFPVFIPDLEWFHLVAGDSNWPDSFAPICVSGRTALRDQMDREPPAKQLRQINTLLWVVTTRPVSVSVGVTGDCMLGLFFGSSWRHARSSHHGSSRVLELRWDHSDQKRHEVVHSDCDATRCEMKTPTAGHKARHTGLQTPSLCNHFLNSGLCQQKSLLSSETAGVGGRQSWPD